VKPSTGERCCRICRQQAKKEYLGTQAGYLAKLRSIIQQANGRISWAQAEIERIEGGSE
jgi:hypothetical protein